MTEYILNLKNGQRAIIDYTLGSSVEEGNQIQLDANHFQQLALFDCTSTLKVTLSADLEEDLEFGFIANVISSRRVAYYDSSKKTKVTVTVPAQCLDGDGQESPFAVPPTSLPTGTKAGEHTLKISYADHPLCAFERKDQRASGEGKTLSKVEGQDKHKIWLTVGQAASGGLSRMNSLGWSVNWLATIEGETVNIDPEKNGPGLEDMPQPQNPVFTGGLARDLQQVTITTYS